jgi:hypothetical protein
MSFIVGQNKDEENQDQQMTGVTTPAPSLTGLSASPPATTGGGTGGGSATAKTPGKFVNFERYLSANDGSRMAGQLASQANGMVDRAQSSLSSAQQEGAQQAQNGTLKWDLAPPEYNFNNTYLAPTSARLSERPPLANFGFQFHQSAPMRNLPGQFNLPDHRPEAHAVMDSTYGGPKNLTEVGGYKNAVSDLDQARQNVNALGSLEGRQAALGGIYGARGGYTRGMGAFDALLASPGDASFADARNRFSNLERAFGTATNDTSVYDQARNQSAAAQQAARAYHDSYVPLNDIQKQWSDYEFNRFDQDHPGEKQAASELAGRLGGVSAEDVRRRGGVTVG